MFAHSIIIAGYLRNINASVLCTCFTRHCTSGRGLNSFDTHDVAQSHCEEAVDVPSQISASSRKDNLDIFLLHCL
jgi:hypothetical protein